MVGIATRPGPVSGNAGPGKKRLPSVGRNRSLAGRQLLLAVVEEPAAHVLQTVVACGTAKEYYRNCL
jgi:hypothetical protein